MGSPGRRDASNGVRAAYRILQIIPFIYLIPFSVILLTEPVIPEPVLNLFNIILTPAIAASPFFVVLSYLFHLCTWNRIAFLLPSGSGILSLVDGYVVEFTATEVIIINTVYGLLVTLFLVLAYKHFFGHGRERLPA